MITPPNPPPWAERRAPWQQVAALAGCFFGAILAGFAVGELLQPEGQAVAGTLIFSLLVVFIGGMALWGTIAASIMAQAVFNGDLARAFLRFFLRGRRKEDLPRLALDPEKLRAAAGRVFGWTRVFVWLAAVLAVVTAPLAGWLATRGFVLAMVLTAVTVISYGVAVRSLARAGYLIPPDEE